jgi:hypothetical protein
VYPEGTLTRDADHWPMIAKTGLARLAIMTKGSSYSNRAVGYTCSDANLRKENKVIPTNQNHTDDLRKPLDFSPWFGKENDPEALIEATAYAMRELTKTLEGIRGEKRPAEIFDPHTSSSTAHGQLQERKKK